MYDGRTRIQPVARIVSFPGRARHHGSLIPIEPSAPTTLGLATMTPSGHSLTQTPLPPWNTGGTGGSALDAARDGVSPFGIVTAHAAAVAADPEVGAPALLIAASAAPTASTRRGSRHARSTPRTRDRFGFRRCHTRPVLSRGSAIRPAPARSRVDSAGDRGYRMSRLPSREKGRHRADARSSEKETVGARGSDPRACDSEHRVGGVPGAADHGSQVNDDPGSGIDKARSVGGENPTNADVVGGALTAGGAGGSVGDLPSADLGPRPGLRPCLRRRCVVDEGRRHGRREVERLSDLPRLAQLRPDAGCRGPGDRLRRRRSDGSVGHVV